MTITSILALESYLNHFYSGRYNDFFIKKDNLNLYQSCFYSVRGDNQDLSSISFSTKYIRLKLLLFYAMLHIKSEINGNEKFISSRKKSGTRFQMIVYDTKSTLYAYQERLMTRRDISIKIYIGNL